MCLSLPGITPENEADVRKLSTESRFEQTVRKAARMMYLKLNPEGKNKLAMSEMLENAGQMTNAEGETEKMCLILFIILPSL